ncbi:SDR family oxidoreductase [uncultured Paraglaciecola sp.]|uniref:SDR family oxidoreductase n=1 Tax=uncultured Paraglaciecola sp. TaxID=1765024 RepID=UPI00260212FB|nr:SDR family oxidoreductase [uncultured Paraglaciecola sp.]
MTRQFQKLVLTGATGGIGAAIASVLDREGYSLLLTGRNEEKLSGLKSTLIEGQHQQVLADLTTSEGIATLKAAASDFNACGVINCLGVNELVMLSDFDSEDVTTMLSTNLQAPIQVCQTLLPLLESQSEAVIVNVGSILGSIGYAGSSIYCASKFGLRGFTESLRRELSDTKVRVIYLAPRATNTALNTDAINQMNRELGNAVDEPGYVAQELVGILRSGKSASRYLGWPESFFVKLNSLFPQLVDKALSKQLVTIKRYCDVNKTEQSLCKPGGVS